MIKVLFVCMGNICRSPTAHGVFEQMIREQELEGDIYVDSAGTIGFHVGAPPDPRSQQTALSRGVDLSSQQSRKVTASDFEEFDYILAMDSANMGDLESFRPANSSAQLSLLLDYSRHWKGQEVPDPYYGGPRGFEDVFERVEDGCRGLLACLQSKL